MFKKPILAAALVASAFATAAHAQAANDTPAADQAEMQAALAAKVPITEAIQAAEKQSGGKAVEVAFSNESGSDGYDVTTVTKDGTEHNLFVDATTGKATKAVVNAEDKNDGNGAAAAEDNDNEGSEQGK